jgi:hypothetical protein
VLSSLKSFCGGKASDEVPSAADHASESLDLSPTIHTRTKIFMILINRKESHLHHY